MPRLCRGIFLSINRIMLALNFYKIRTGLDIHPIDQGGNLESQARYDQILQTIGQRGEFEHISKVFKTIEKSPADLGAYVKRQRTIYVLIFGVDKNRSGWTGSDLKMTMGNMITMPKVLEINPDAEDWIGGLENNISCEAAYFDLRTKKKKK